jgi:acetyl esterase/lipase
LIFCSYRLAPRTKLKDAITDLKRVIRWARANSHIHGGDPSYIAVSGGSAGGHLASLLALTPNWPEFQPDFEDVNTKVDACLAFYPANHPMGGAEKATKWFKKVVVGMDDETSMQAMNGRKVDEWADPVYLVRDLKKKMLDGGEKHVLNDGDVPPFFVIQGVSLLMDGRMLLKDTEA